MAPQDKPESGGKKYSGCRSREMPGSSKGKSEKAGLRENAGDHHRNDRHTSSHFSKRHKYGDKTGLHRHNENRACKHTRSPTSAFWPRSPSPTSFYKRLDEIELMAKREREQEKAPETDDKVEKEATISAANVPSNSDTQVSGPHPLPLNQDKHQRFGDQLLPGEGSAMAAYVSSGKRIPRRGEIGLASGQIAEFEAAGFVMSGSRHHVMNAVRLRKENQVLNVEEERRLAREHMEERLKRENVIISEFKELVQEKMRKIQRRQ